LSDGRGVIITSIIPVYAIDDASQVHNGAVFVNCSKEVLFDTCLEEVKGVARQTPTTPDG
jgi:hypothetical protein